MRTSCRSLGRHLGMLGALPLALGLFARIACAQPAQSPVPPSIPPGCERIGSIRIVHTDVFDTRLPEEDRALFRLANALHIDTRASTLRQLLLFKVGDPYDPRLLQESERLMRSTGYLGNVAVEPVACVDGQAEIEVRAQDMWTLKPSVSFGRKGGKNSSAIGIDDSNLFGLGTQLGLDLRSGVDRSTRLLSYHDPLLGGRRLDLSASHASNSDGRQSTFGLERPFYALDTRWAAGISGRRETRIDSTYAQGQITGRYQVQERHGQVFGGLSEGLHDGWVSRWTMGWTHDEHNAQPIPTDGVPPSTQVPVSRRLAYPWLGAEWVEDAYRETSNFEQIGKTEDLALGWHVLAQLGVARPAFGADRNATVFTVKLSKGLQPQPGHTLLFDGSADGRLEAGQLKGTLFSGSASYHFKQSARRSFYASITADRSVRPDADQQVLLGGDSGLRGYPLRYQSGKGRWLFTTEQRWYSEWYPWRIFNVGWAAFYDMGRAWDQDPAATQRLGLLRDVGFGLRLGNSRSAIGSVVHVDLAFPLDGDRSIKKVQLIMEAKRSF